MYHIDPHKLPNLKGLRGIRTAGLLRLQTDGRGSEDKQYDTKRLGARH